MRKLSAQQIRDINENTDRNSIHNNSKFGLDLGSSGITEKTLSKSNPLDKEDTLSNSWNKGSLEETASKIIYNNY